MRSQVASVLESLQRQHPDRFGAAIWREAASQAPADEREPRKDLITVVALDLDDTIWPTMAWIKKLGGLGNGIIERHLPRACVTWSSGRVALILSR